MNLLAKKNKKWFTFAYVMTKNQVYHCFPEHGVLFEKVGKIRNFHQIINCCGITVKMVMPSLFKGNKRSNNSELRGVYRIEGLHVSSTEGGVTFEDTYPCDTQRNILQQKKNNFCSVAHTMKL